MSSNNLILSGIIVAAILAAGISFLKYIADEQVAVIIFWLMGSFAAKTWVDVSLTLAFVGVGLIVFILVIAHYNRMNFECDDVCWSLPPVRDLGEKRPPSTSALFLLPTTCPRPPATRTIRRLRMAGTSGGR